MLVMADITYLQFFYDSSTRGTVSNSITLIFACLDCISIVYKFGVGYAILSRETTAILLCKTLRTLRQVFHLHEQ